MQPTPPILDAIHTAAQAHRIPDTLLLGIVMTESGGNPYALRAEPGYRYVWDCAAGAPFRPLERFELQRPAHPSGFTAFSGMSADTEWWGQRCSWGPMQVMGAVARELGFKGHFPALCGEMGIGYGARHLLALKRRFFDRYGWESVVAAYNAGSPRRDASGILENAGYVAKVRKNGWAN
jgi:soluble lytic murein transglycosylase-like protein